MLNQNFESYQNLSMDELGLLLKFYGKLSKLPRKELPTSPEMTKRLYTTLFQMSPELQWGVLWRGLLLTLLFASSAGFIIGFLVKFIRIKTRPTNK